MNSATTLHRYPEFLRRFSFSVLLVGSTLLAFASPTVANEELLLEAEEELLGGDYPSAEKWFQKLIQLEDLNDETLQRAYFGLSQVHSEQGKYKLAEQLLTQGSEKLPNSSRLLARLAQIRFTIGNYEQAAKDVQRALDIDSQDLLARFVQAQLLTESGNIEEATSIFRSFVRTYNRLQPTDSRTLVTIGQGAAVYARWESVSQVFRFVVNTLCPDALEDNSHYWPAYVLSGELLLEKYNQGQALPEFYSALEINPNCADALAAMAKASLQDSKIELALQFAENALKHNPNHLPSLTIKAGVQLLSEDPVNAAATLQQAFNVNPLHQELLGIQAALDLLQHSEISADQVASILNGKQTENEPSQFEKNWSELVTRNPRPGIFLETTGSLLDARRRYEHAKIFYQKAFELMPQLSGPKTSLGMLYMRTGEIDQAEELLEKAFEADPFHVRVSNMKKVIQVLNTYETIASDHFVIRAASNHRLMAKMAAEYLEQIYPELTERYGFEPPVRTQFEIYSTAKDQSGHSWFSARMTGLPWFQTIGASTGKIVALTTPTESEQPFNWKRVLRHEFVHILTLQKTGFNIPHWLTEAISVSEENISMPAEWQNLLLNRYDSDSLFDLSNLNRGFQQPKGPNDWTLAYCQSYLYAEFMQTTFGDDALRRILDTFVKTTTLDDAINLAFDTSLVEFEQGYTKFIEPKIRRIRRSQPPPRLRFQAAQQLVNENPDDASAHAQLALAMFPQLQFQQPVLDEIETSLQLDNKEPIANALRASYLLSQDKNEEALKQLEQGDVSSSHQPLFLRVQARVYSALGRHEDAEEVLLFAINRFPLDPFFDDQLLEFYDDTAADNKKVQTLLEKMADQSSDHIPSRKRLARLLSNTGTAESAIRWAQEAIAVAPQDLEMHEILVTNSLAANQTILAAHATENLLLLDELTTEAMPQFVQQLQEKQLLKRASNVLNQLLEADPKHARAKDLLILIEKNR